jgi:Acetyltransferases
MVEFHKNKYEIKETKNFTEAELKELFSSVGWLSANYSHRLTTAMKNSGTVVSAWDKDKLIGLMNVLDDGEMTAYAHYLLVHRDYQGKGIGKELVAQVKEKYKSYLYLVLLCEEKKNVDFYKKLDFTESTGVTPLQILSL